MKIQQLKEEVIGAVARGWTYKKNSSKEMDVELVTAITQEVLPLITKACEEGKRDGRKEGREEWFSYMASTINSHGFIGLLTGEYELIKKGKNENK